MIEEKLIRVLNIRKKLVQVATYPIVLLAFLIFIMLGLKNYLLPQLEENKGLATYAIQNLPTLFLGWLFSLFVFFYLCRYYWKKKTALEALRLMVKIPFVGRFVQLYLTAYFAREWGNLIAQAVDLRQICFIMQE